MWMEDEDRNEPMTLGDHLFLLAALAIGVVGVCAWFGAFGVLLGDF